MKPRILSTARLSFPLAAAIAAMLAAPSAQATDYYWDTNGAAGFGAVGPFTWDGVNTFWNTDITGATGGTFIASPTNADDLSIIGGTTGTITLSGTQVVSSLTFANNVAKTLSGGTSLTIGGSGTRSGIFVNTGDNAANIISSPLILDSTSTALNFSNAGTGLLTIGAVTGSAAGTQTITVGASNAGGITLNGIIGNGGGGGNVALTINSSGTGITSLTAANSYTGAVSVNAGVLNIQHATALGTVAGGTTVASGAALQIQNNITVGAEALTLNGTGFNNTGALRSISGNNNYGGLVTLGSSTIISSDTAANTLTLSNVGTITGAGFDLTAGGVGNITINGNIGTTTGALTKIGAGTLTLTGANTYTGNTLVRAGTLQVTSQVSLYNNGVAATWTKDNIKVGSGATIAFNVVGAGQFTKANINTLLGLSDSASNGFMTGSNVGLDTTGGSLLFDSVIANANSGSNVLGLTKLGTNTLTLDQNNTYTGGTIISAGTLQLGNGGTTGKLSTSSSILNNGTLTINRSNPVVQGTDFSGAPITGTGALTLAGGSSTTLNAANTFSGTTTVSGVGTTLILTNDLAVQNSALVTTGGGTVTFPDATPVLGGLSGATGDLSTVIPGFASTTALSLNATAGSFTYGGIISDGAGTMTLTKNGASTQILSGANTYTGDTFVNGGTLTVGSGANGSLNSSSGLQMGGGIFNYSRTGAGQTVDGLTVNAGNSTVNNTSSGQTLTLGTITRTASIYGTVNFATLTGAITTTTGNTKSILGPWATTGSTTTLKYAVGSPDGSTPTNISALTGTAATAGTLANVTDSTANYDYTGAATTSANLTANTLRFSGTAATTAIGATNTLTLNGLMNASGGSTYTISGGPTTGGIIIGSTNELVIAANAQATTISARIADGASAGRLVYSGGGTLTLQGINLYTGGTTINAGIVSLTSTATVSPTIGTGAVTVNPGGRLAVIAGFGSLAVTVTNPLTLNGGTLQLGGGNSAANYSGPITLAANSTVEGGNSNFETNPINGAISGAGGFTKTGLGPIRLNGTNTYTGPTVISSGAIIVKSSLYGNDSSKWTPANITVASNAVLGLSVGGAGEFTMAQATTMFTNLTSNVNNNGLLANSFMSVDTRNASGTNAFTYSSVLTDSTGPGGGAVNFKYFGTSTNTLQLTAANTYSGLTMIEFNGILRVSSLNSVFTNPALGTVHSASSSLGAPTTVTNGAIWLGAGGYNGNSHPGTTYQAASLVYTGSGETTDRVLTLGANGTYILDQSGSGLLKFTSQPNVTFKGGTLVLQGSTTGSGEIAPAITNGQPFAYTKNGTGTWTLSGASLHTGVTTVSGGALVLANANALNGGIGSTGGLGALTFNGGVIGLGAGDFSRPLAAAGTVTGVNFTGNGGWAAYGADRTVNLGGAAASVTWATANTGLNGKTLILGNATSTHTVDLQNPLDLTNAARTVQVDNGAAVIDGKLSGALTGIAGGNLIKSGLGTLALTATAGNSYLGTTTVNAGTLLVNNTTGSGTGAGNVSVTVGTLGGSGSISGTVTIGNGTVAVTDSTLAPGNSIDSLDTGNLTFNSDGSYAVELNGSLVTTDVTNVTGSVSINAATTLTVNVAGTLSASQQYVIVSNDGVDPVSGTFAGLAQDAVVVSPGGTDLKISYTGGDGNDIVLYTDASGSPYDAWAILKGLTGAPGFENAKGADPDNDGRNNLAEFAFDGNPLSGVNDGKIVGKVATVGGNQVMTLTLPVRAVASFSPDSGDQLSALIDGIYYRIEGDANLSTFSDTITEVTGGDATAIQSGLPALSAVGAPGWTYRTFRHSGTVPATPKAFLRAKASETP